VTSTGALVQVDAHIETRTAKPPPPPPPAGGGPATANVVPSTSAGDPIGSLHVAGDNSYTVYVNGVETGRCAHATYALHSSACDFVPAPL
jgi:hypothetical protein